MKSKTEILEQIKIIVGEKYVISNPDQLYNYSKVNTNPDVIMPLAAVLPGTVLEISKIMELCNKYLVKVVVRGGGTSVNGSVAPYENEIVLSTERLNQIIEINKIDRTVIAEAGVITEDLQKSITQQGMCFPQNISSAGSCYIGGNIAISSGSPKSLKYGTTKNFVLNLEVVLPDGRIIWTGKNVSKNATGYNITQLIVGSEGTLGIITKVVLQLVSCVKETLVLIPFDSIKRLLDFVQLSFANGLSASSMEFVDGYGYKLVSEFLNKSLFNNYSVKGLLWIEFEEKSRDDVMNKMLELLEKAGGLIDENNILFADSESEIKNLWEFRKRIGDAVSSRSTFIDLDIVVPRSKISEMYFAIELILAKNDLQFTVMGHVGSGNFHINILKSGSTEWQQVIESISIAIFEKAINLGGTISGEHGIGKTHKTNIRLAFSNDHLEIMKQIKQIFDPNNILNSQRVY